MIGRTISHYSIEARLGEGGMGTVYLARDTTLGRKVAIKVISPEAAGDPDGRARLLREAQSASRLNHPNVVTVYEIGSAEGIDFIAMEHVEGQPLSRLIAPGGLPIAQVLDYGAQLAAAMAAAHAAGIVHRDLKPANLMVTPGGRLKVLDLGLAKRLERRDADTMAPTRSLDPASLTVPGALLGTVGFMAPEQIEGRTADERSDVFSIGVVLFEMLAGRRPFVGDSPVAVLAATVAGSAPPVASLRPDTPPALAAIVTRCLERRPEDRYPAAAGLAADLARLAPARRAAGAPRALVAVLALLGLLAAATSVALLVRESRQRWARETAPEEVARRIARDDLVGAYAVARRALEIAPRDSRVQQTWSNLALERAVHSSPPGADVAIHSFQSRDGPWVPLGRTPIESARVPVGLVRWRLTKPGYDTLEVVQGLDQMEFVLTPAGTTPPGMVRVPAGSYQLESTGEEIRVPAYWLDRFEVTNRQYQAFVDSGGYRRPGFWKEPFVKDGRTLTWPQAMAEFRDATGRPGPSTWEYGGYPEGQGDFPVAGVSWYEAAAYAAFAGKRLPTAHHWYRAAGAFGPFSDVIAVSNFSGKGPARVGSTPGLGPFGTLDMAGNVKEWCWNSASHGRRYILGGGWDEPSYMFRDQDAQSPFERRADFGLRCMRAEGPIEPRLAAEIPSFERDPATLEPVGDELFGAYRRLYDYDPTPLDARVEAVDDANPAWRRERVSIRAAYGDERLPINLFLPRSSRPPYQAVVFFPGSNATMTSSSQNLMLARADFHVRAGRALVYPVYQGTYERRKPGVKGMSELRDILIERGKDIRRTVDYLQSRRDIDGSRIAFFGISLGAQMGPVYLVIEPRFKTGVFFSGGFETWQIPPECDPVNFAPHVKTSVLMVNGREDFDLPYATAQVPMFRMLGTPPGEKRHAVFEGGHIPSHPQEAVRVMLEWLDAKLGPVR